MVKKIAAVFVLFVFSVVLTHCDALTNAGGGSTTDSGTTATTTTSTVASNLETVENDFAPDSLDYTQNSASVSVAAFKAEGSDSGDPCANAADLYDCQPILLQLYYAVAKSILSTVKEIVSEVGTSMGTVVDGTAGSASWGTATVEYSKTSSTDYSILLSVDSSPMGYIDVAENVYTVQMDLNNIPEEDAGGNGGMIETTVTYTDENTWSVVFLLTDMPCSDADVAAPERIKIQVDKAGGLWSGKAMMYSGRWYGQNITCDDDPSESASMNFYTKFVGNDTAAQAHVYMMNRAKDSLDDIDDFGMDSLATNFPHFVDDASAYTNPFCNPAGTLDAFWGDDCSSQTDTTVSEASFGGSEWVVPSEFWGLTITLPTSLTE